MTQMEIWRGGEGNVSQEESALDRLIVLMLPGGGGTGAVDNTGGSEAGMI